MVAFVQQAVRWHRPLMTFAAAMAVLAVIAGLGVVIDDRVLVGAPIWLKPFKFAVSFVLYAVTLAWMLSLLHRGRRVAWRTATAITAASVIEMVIIVGQVVRGRQSHFNELTEFDTVLWRVMGATIVALWIGTLVIAVLLLRQRFTDRTVAWSVRFGLVLALIGMGLGFLMTLPTPEQRAADLGITGAHSVGVPDGGPGMFLTGWSTTGGDLRIAHFVGLHALQLLPLLALVLTILAGRFAALRVERVRRHLLAVAAGGYAGLIALLTWQALRGQPLIRPDSATATAAGVLVATVAVAVALVVRGAPRPSKLPAVERDEVSV